MNPMYVIIVKTTDNNTGQRIEATYFPHHAENADLFTWGMDESHRKLLVITDAVRSFQAAGYAVTSESVFKVVMR